MTTENEVKQAEPKVYLLTPYEAAEALHSTVGTLAVWRCTRRYALRFTKIGRKIFYRPEDIEKFVRQGGVPGDSPKPKRAAKKQTAKKQ
jgi:Helix-turn-helix domain